jgi:hypothetical protein
VALSQRRLPEARAKSDHALTLAGNEYKSVTIAAKSTLGLAQALSGSAREGKMNCDAAARMAVDAGDFSLLSRALLALAEAALIDGDAELAVEKAIEAQARFARGNQQESEWRAWLIAAQANQRLNRNELSQEQLTKAKAILAQLEQRWGPEVQRQYLTRPDIQVYYKQLG